MADRLMLLPSIALSSALRSPSRTASSRLPMENVASDALVASARTSISIGWSMKTLAKKMRPGLVNVTSTALTGVRGRPEPRFTRKRWIGRVMTLDHGQRSGCVDAVGLRALRPPLPRHCRDWRLRPWRRGRPRSAPAGALYIKSPCRRPTPALRSRAAIRQRRGWQCCRHCFARTAGRQGARSAWG